MTSYADFVTDRALLGGLPAFAHLSSWRRWLVFLKALEGLPLDDDERAIFCQHTGLTEYAPPPGGYPESLAVVGRQSGKSRVAGSIQAVDAVRATQEPEGAGTYCITVAQDARGAQRAVFSYAVEPFDTLPMFQRLVVARTQDTVTLVNGVRLAVYPCRASSVRGLRARAMVLDEAAFYYTSDLRAVDVEVWRAARPTLLSTRGRLVILSSPYAQVGLVYDLFRRHYAQPGPMLVWRGSSTEMNPSLDARRIARLRASDPEGAQSEIDAEFRAGLSVLFDPDAVDACVRPGVKERAPEPGVRYVAGVDISGGRRDRAAVALAHRVGEHIVLDGLRSWVPPFDPSAVIGEMAAWLRGFGVRVAYGDAFAAEFTVREFLRAGITYRSAEADRSELYLSLVPLVLSQRAVLLDHPHLIHELKSLERRKGASGRDRVDHRVGGFDDHATATAVAMVRDAKPVNIPFGMAYIELP